MKMEQDFLSNKKRISILMDQIRLYIVRIYQNKHFPTFLFMMGFLISVFYSCKGIYHDEGDNLSLGWMISSGKVLYRDVFSHHLPLTYFWSALISLVFGNNLFIHRLGIVFLTLFTFFIGARLSKKPVIIGFQYIFWELIKPHILGNLVMYHSLNSLTLFLILILVFYSKQFSKTLDRRREMGLLGLLASITLLNSPLPVYAVGIAVIYFIVQRLIIEKGDKFNAHLSSILKTLSPFLFGFLFLPLAFLIYLFLTDSLMDFFEQAILFNFQYYAENINTFHQANTLSPLRVLYYVITFHRPGEIFIFYPYNPNWTSYYLVFVSTRLIVVVYCLWLIIRKEYLKSLFIYLFMAALLLRFAGANSQNYMINSLFIMCLFCFDIGAYFKDKRIPVKSSRLFQEKAQKVFTWIRLIFLFVFLLVMLVFFIDFVPQIPLFFENMQFTSLKNNQEMILNIKEYCPNLEIVSYPGDMYIYFLTKTHAASQFTFLFPWVDAYANEKINQDLQLKKDQPVLVIYDYDFHEYEPVQLLPFLNHEYHLLSEGIWGSDGLRQCYDGSVLK